MTVDWSRLIRRLQSAVNRSASKLLEFSNVNNMSPLHMSQSYETDKEQDTLCVLKHVLFVQISLFRV